MKQNSLKKSDYHNQSDYELIVLYKQNPSNQVLLSQIREILFFRYKPFIYKRFLRMQKQFSWKIAIEKDEFLAEAFINITNALAYVNLAKITSPHKWKFLGVLMYYINIQCQELIHNFLKTEKFFTPLYIVHPQTQEEINVIDFVGKIQMPQAESTVEEKEQIQTFLQSLTQFEKQVFEKRIDVKIKGKPKPLLEIADELGVSFSKVQTTCKVLEQKWQRVLKSE